MRVLICKNTVTEGPGTIEDFLISKGVAYKVVELASGEELPDPERFDTLLMLGGPMSVNEEDRYPYIGKEVNLVRYFTARDRKILGVCLGSQIIAKALGAKVYKGPVQEIGWHDIELTGEGLQDPLMAKLALHREKKEAFGRIRVFQWHGETFDIPPGAQRLAGSDLFPNQAFKFGENTYAFQFHIEVTKDMIEDWLKDENLDMTALHAETERLYASYYKRAEAFYEGFFDNKEARKSCSPVG